MFDLIFGSILKISESLGLKDLFKGKEAKLMEFQLKMAREMTAINSKQIEVNIEEAKHKSIFVAGWRPFIGWACGGSLVYNFILQPFIFLFLQIADVDIPLPTIEISQLVAILMAMLGMSGYRTYEKIKNVAK